MGQLQHEATRKGVGMLVFGVLLTELLMGFLSLPNPITVIPPSSYYCWLESAKGCFHAWGSCSVFEGWGGKQLTWSSVRSKLVKLVGWSRIF